MSEPHKVSKPRFYHFLVVENAYPHYVLERMPPEANYERVWHRFFDKYYKYGDRDVSLKVYTQKAGGRNGTDLVMTITGPDDLEKL